MQLFNERTSQYVVADFYAGIAASTFEMNVRSELQQCMVKDDELVNLWGEAISHLSHGREDKWRSSFLQALDRSTSDLAGCGAQSSKLSMLGHQLDNWWETFWGQGDEVAFGIYDQNRTANKGNLLKQVFTMRFNWETGYSFDAGKRLGNFWKILIGEPVWTDAGYHNQQQQEQEDYMYDGRYPLADFYAAMFEEVWGEDVYEQVQQCLIRDEMHFEAMGLMLQAMQPFDQLQWDKYYAVVQTLNDYNWVNCFQDLCLSEVLGNDGECWNNFWEMENADEIFDLNSERFSEEIEATIEKILTGWEYGDAIMAGRAYGHFWDVLLTYKNSEEQPQQIQTDQ